MQHIDVSATLRDRARAIHMTDTEIARVTGLHRLTVARVLRGSPRVLKDTEARIAGAIADRETELRQVLGVAGAVGPHPVPRVVQAHLLAIAGPTSTTPEPRQAEGTGQARGGDDPPVAVSGHLSPDEAAE